ncbi:MAG: ATP-binding protein [Nitrospirae bacterium]|nr:ATP-binding protein [Nitrospirota bacterium]
MSFTYAVIRYRLIDINIVIKKTMAYSILVGTLTGLYVALVFALTSIVSEFAKISSFKINLLSAFIIALLFTPLNNRIQIIINKFFHKTSYNYYTVIQKASRELSAKIYLKDIQKFIVELIADTLKIKDAHFLLAGGKYYVTVYHMKSKDKSSDESTYKRLRIRNDSELIRLLKDRRDIIIREELPGFIESDRAEAIAADMAPFSGEAAAPIISDGELEAIMILGGKQSGDIFTDEDINLLRTISNETALSMKTASLYAEKLRTERLATVGMTATTLAHEIKNPLSSIKTFSQLLPEKYADEEFRDTFAAIVPGEIQRIDNLVTELLTFTRNAPSSNMERIEITTLIEDSLKLFSDQFRKSNVKVIKDYSEPLYIKGERVRIKQALINILSNGCQAMENGGVLKIATVFDDKININIEDSGAGIHEKDIERVFEPFFTTKATGNGLGLTISKKIIEDHGGSISVSSRQNEGTAFTLSFEPADDVKEDYKGEQPLLWNS